MNPKPEYGKTFYYQDELKDDFSPDTGMRSKPLPENYRYVRKGWIFRLTAFFLYHFVALPIVYIVAKFTMGIRVRGRKHVRHLRGGYFMYGNHSHMFDMFLAPVFITGHKRTYTLSHPAIFSKPAMRRLVSRLGALPVPDGYRNYVRFLEALEWVSTKKKKAVVIFPEAHIWPYYTGIRNFPATSFIYPAKFKVPVVPFVTTYRYAFFFGKHRKPKMTVHVGPPIRIDPALSEKENAQRMRDYCYHYMKGYADRPNNIALYHYVKKEPSEA